jgi:hypothetical protein
LTTSPSASSSMSMDSSYSDIDNKRFFSEKYAKCSVKGNFLTLAAQPKNVELGEWLAHQRKGWGLQPLRMAQADQWQWWR